MGDESVPDQDEVQQSDSESGSCHLPLRGMGRCGYGAVNAPEPSRGPGTRIVRRELRSEQGCGRSPEVETAEHRRWRPSPVERVSAGSSPVTAAPGMIDVAAYGSR